MLLNFEGGHEFQSCHGANGFAQTRKDTDMTTNEQWARMMEEHEIAYLRGDLAASSPQSYTLGEMREISAGMEASTAEVEAAMRADFCSMPRFAQERMLELLGASDYETREWWERLLKGDAESAVV